MTTVIALFIFFQRINKFIYTDDRKKTFSVNAIFFKLSNIYGYPFLRKSKFKTALADPESQNDLVKAVFFPILMGSQKVEIWTLIHCNPFNLQARKFDFCVFCAFLRVH